MSMLSDHSNRDTAEKLESILKELIKEDNPSQTAINTLTKLYNEAVDNSNSIYSYKSQSSVLREINDKFGW